MNISLGFKQSILGKAGSIIATVGVVVMPFTSLLPVVAYADSPHTASIAINLLNGHNPSTYSTSCPGTNPLTSPVIGSGSGTVTLPLGSGPDQYHVSIDWGDGTVEVASSTFIVLPNGDYTFTFDVGSHSYLSQTVQSIVATVYHATSGGHDSIDASSLPITVCVNPTTGGLTITKTTTGGDGTFSFTGNGGIGSFTITTSGGTGNKSFSNLATSTTYTIVETPLAGWAQNSNSCSGISITAGATSTCAVANTKKASLTVIKHVINDNGGAATAANFTMNVTGTNVSSASFAGSESGTVVTMDAGDYSVDESANASYTKSIGTSCSGTLAAGGTATCTITNDDIAPTLTLDKVVVNGDAGTATEDQWTLTANGGTAGTLSGAGAAGSTDVVSGATFKAGVYALSEAGTPSHYQASGWVCIGGTQNGANITIGLAQNVTCTITNTFVSPVPGSITIVKNTVGGDGTFAFTSDFALSSLTTNGGTVSQTFSGLPAGPYSVAETAQDGWDLTSATCTSGTPSSITLAEGGSVTCTFINTARGHIIVKKVTNPSGAQDSFHFTASWNDSTSFDLTDGQTNDSGAITPGTYSVSEVLPEGALWTSNGVCDNEDSPSSVHLAAGQTVTCTFTNTSTLSDLAISKSVDNSTPDNGATVVFTLTVVNHGPADASGVVVHDQLPDGVTYVSDDGAGTYATSTNNWTVGSLANGATATLHITATVSASAGTQVTNTAGVSDENGDSNSDNNSGSVTFTVNTPTPTPTPAPPPPSGGGGGNGPIAGSLGFGGGAVLGASTSTVGQVLGASCGLYMDKHLRLGSKKNDKEQTVKLQGFLNKWMGANLPVTGFFGPLTNAAVKNFQAKYTQEVLAPWGLSTPTGLVYLSTLRQVNLLECPQLSLQLPVLIPWSQNPNAQ